MRQGSGVAEAAVQDELLSVPVEEATEDMPATEESIPPEDGAASRDGICSSRLLCVAGRAG